METLKEMLANREELFDGFAGTQRTAATIGAAWNDLWQWAVSRGFSYTFGDYKFKKASLKRDSGCLRYVIWPNWRRASMV